MEALVELKTTVSKLIAHQNAGILESYRSFIKNNAERLAAGIAVLNLSGSAGVSGAMANAVKQTMPELKYTTLSEDPSKIDIREVISAPDKVTRLMRLVAIRTAIHSRAN